ncbi:Glu/Leu/Phe/Val dehydrogenase family protein [Actinoplanes awajinensis]|uniref:Amino acid dehydrogenase n=1 Tax=Actinoplanes awajinensis subsp. mycoplanecinus TaxID=135947 RepID=A0A101JPY7_9ACTN|nr:Glu/Leu/Phe/Val dehydrogenase dimerization domain-containing protein [Actinoplanes awajinensis]KUL30872.1 amino acid dehydrogenase [Actinoplanes awajinensis subsp. mycoplanecinus]
MNHEHVVTQRGRRSRLPITVAIHSTARGRAAGGCRIAAYPHWRDGVTDALRLSQAMSGKCAIAGLPLGGGKTVVSLPLSYDMSTTARRDLLQDIGDLIASLHGAYATGPDVGTGPDDMAVIGERTDYVFCRPESAGGSGDSSLHTATGVLAALRAVCAHRFGGDDLSARSVAVLGLGRVGAHVLRMLAGARVIAADVDPGRRDLATRYGATWVSPQDCLTADVDVLIPAALGGLLTAATVPTLRCAAIAGPANNQLDVPATAGLLHERGILWAPDIAVSAGGLIHATARELLHETPEQAAQRVAAIGATLTGLLDTAAGTGITPAAAADQLAAGRLLVS